MPRTRQRSNAIMGLGAGPGVRPEVGSKAGPGVRPGAGQTGGEES